MSRVAYQGAPGAFGEEAASRLWPGWNPVGARSFSDVVRLVVEAEAEAGVLPVENRIVGRIGPALDALDATTGVELSGEVTVPVRLHLLGLPGTTPAMVRRIAGHPMALAQCRGRLARLSARVEEWFDSAGAAEIVAAWGDRSVAVVAGEAARVRYGLEVVLPDVHDRPDNATRFVGFSRRT